MKTRIYKIMMLVAFISIASCEDYLDVNPDFGLTEDDVFSSFESTRGYLDNCYEVLIDMHDFQSKGSQRESINILSDEAGTPLDAWGGWIVRRLHGGAWSNQAAGTVEIGWGGNTTYTGTVMGNAVYAIRIANKVITRIEANEVPGLTEEQKNELLGQAYFFRAWNYFQIIQRVGGMPLLDKAFATNDDVDLDRLTYSESSEWLVSDLDKAIAILPDVYNDSEFGRVTKGAAMAVKTMATLYAASPLMQNDTNSTQYLNYSQEWSERAAAAGNDLIKYINAGSGGAGFRLMSKSEYKNIFYTDGIQASPESLWYRLNAGKRNNSRGIRSNYLPQRFSVGTGNDAAAFSNPTQNIVDMYEVINGGVAYPISDARSGYDDQNPFVNRDPRLYNNVILPGEEWGVDKSGNTLYQELYVDGADYDLAKQNSNTKNRDITGYMCKKYIWPEANNLTQQFNLYNLNQIYIRVAQVYLDYAEAMNEAYGPTSDPKGFGLTAVQAINIIRNRVDMPNVLSEHTASKEIFRERIRNERAVELMWENKRWHDLRRWMIAEDVFKTPIRGVRAIPQSDHESIADKSTLSFTYEYFDSNTEQRVFALRNYWYPVGETDAQDLFNYKQNPGW